jgi:heterodisulfide reductase subunit B/ferredoxin
MLSDYLPGYDIFDANEAIDKGIVRKLKDCGDPRLANYLQCYWCGSCTPLCPAQINSPENDSAGRYVPRKLIQSVRSGSQLGINIDDCVQCYTCETLCPKGISIGGIINAMYDERDERLPFKALLQKCGQLPPRAFFPIYATRWKIGNFMRKAVTCRHRVNERAIREIQQLTANPLPVSHIVPSVNGSRRKALPRVDGVFHLRSCCAFNYPGADQSQRHILEALGIECITSEDQTCCGGAPYYMGGIGLMDKTLLTARNICVIQREMGSNDPIYVTGICPTCSDSYSSCLKMLSQAKNGLLVDGALTEIGRQIDHTRPVHVANILELYPPYIGDLKNLVMAKFSGLRIGVHVSCHFKKLIGNVNVTAGMRALAAITGAEVSPGGMEHYCCGGVKNLFDRHMNGTPNVTPRLNTEVMLDFTKQNLDLMVVDCPGCELVYDHMGIPVMHVSQYLALALGADPKKTVGIQHHITSLDPMLQKAGIAY